MTDDAVVGLPAPDLDSDVELLARYLTNDMSPDAMDDVSDRIETDAQFRATALPLISMWALPVRFREVFPEKKDGESPRRFARRVDRYLRKRHSVSSMTREWNGLFRLVGMPPMPYDEIMEVPPAPAWRRWLRRIVLTVITLFLLLVLGVVAIFFFARPQVRTFQQGAAADSAGRSLPPGGTLWKPATYETKTGEERKIANERYEVALSQNSWLATGTEPVSTGPGDPVMISAIDGAAWVTVFPRKVFIVNVADVLFYCMTGRHHIAHPLHGPTQIYVEQGHVWLGPFRKRSYPPGSVITIQAVDTLTIVHAVWGDGTPATTDTLKNLAKNRFAHPAGQKK